MPTETQLAVQSLAHDLKNVFQTIVQAADLMASDPSHSELASIILRSVDQGRRILADAAESRGNARLASAVEAAVQFTRDFATMDAGPQINFDINVDPEIVTEMRPAPLERCLMNLFINALGAARAARRASVSLRVATRQSGADVTITVEDDGPGIPSDALQHVFHAGFSATGTGQGLGLHIVESAVAESGGKVTARNGATGGAVFTLRLPLAQKAHAACGQQST